MSQDEDETYHRRRTAFGAPGAGAVTGAEYDAVRPTWPLPTLSWLLGSPAPGTSLDVVDLGAGTGKGTRPLAVLGHRVSAVEPSDGMRATLSDSLASLPADLAGQVSVLAGAADEIPLPDASVDAVVALQAWHWFDHEAAATESARVLRPGGWLSMAWHQRDESQPWAAEVSRIVHRSGHIGDATTGDDSDELGLTEAFDRAEMAVLRFTMQQSIDDFVRHAATWSYVSISPVRDEMLAGVRAAVEREFGAAGTVLIPMTTRCYRARRH